MEPGRMRISYAPGTKGIRQPSEPRLYIYHPNPCQERGDAGASPLYYWVFVSSRAGTIFMRPPRTVAQPLRAAASRLIGTLRPVCGLPPCGADCQSAAD